MFVKTYPYDYVSDKTNWIYLVKGEVHDTQMLIGAPIYSPPPLRNKCKTDGAFHKTLYSKKTLLSSGFDREIHKSEIIKYYPIININCSYKKNNFNHSNIINYIYTESKKFGVKIYLFGSRLLGLETECSDWDFVIQGCKNPQLFVKNLIKQGHGRCRGFSSQEIYDRVDRYVLSESWASSIILEKIFSKTTTYLKSDCGELGIFFRKENNIYLPIASEFNFCSEIKGKIIRNKGGSYSMPREILIDYNNKIIKIKTISWLLCGLEEFEGSYVRFQGIYKLSENEWWFGANGSNITIY